MAVSKQILQRVQEKKLDYIRYGFSRVQSNVLKTFFDLAQEFESLEDVYQASVAILKSFLLVDARLYLVDSKGNELVLVAASEDKEVVPGDHAPQRIKPSEQPYYVGQALILTILGNKQLIEQVPLSPGNDVMGVLEVFPCEDLDRHQELFYQKYANRIGFSIHLRLLLQKNIEHVKFIRTLVADIEHNVIVPNMVYRLFLSRLKGKIKKNQEIEELLSGFVREHSHGVTSAEALVEEISEVNRGLSEEFGNIERHYQNSSLFLETLLRRSHFDEGHLTLSTGPCRIKQGVIDPQLEHFSERFSLRNIEIVDEFFDEGDEDTVAVIDVGLMAQVYSNLFSNALKYAGEVDLGDGKVGCYMSFGRERIKDYFGHGKHGIKYYVFNTGTHVPLEERHSVFKEGFRGAGAAGRPGSGHGLTFVKSAIEIHGGVVGYEPIDSPAGNRFYFILPE